MGINKKKVKGLSDKEFEALIKDVKKKAEKYADAPIDTCRNCGKKMYRCWDDISKEFSKYIHYCVCMPKHMRLMTL